MLPPRDYCGSMIESGTRFRSSDRAPLSVHYLCSQQDSQSVRGWLSLFRRVLAFPSSRLADIQKFCSRRCAGGREFRRAQCPALPIDNSPPN
jgi:hypothetical protein